MSRIQHIVLLRFPRPLTPEEENDMREQVRGWPEAIGGFVRLRLGRDTSGRAHGFTHGLMIEFEGPEAEASYHPHPTHQAFARWVAERGGEVLAFDYPVDDTTRVAGD